MPRRVLILPSLDVPIPDGPFDAIVIRRPTTETEARVEEWPDEPLVVGPSREPRSLANATTREVAPLGEADATHWAGPELRMAGSKR